MLKAVLFERLLKRLNHGTPFKFFQIYPTGFVE